MWWEVVSILACLQLLAGVCHAVTVTQKERYKIIQVGIQTSIDCNHDDNTYLTILWYRQDSNSADRTLQLVGYSVHGNDPEMTMTTYTIQRSNVTHASLSVPARQAADSAVYFCAASKGTASTSCLTAAHERWSSPASTHLSHNCIKPNHVLDNISKDGRKHSSCSCSCLIIIFASRILG